SELLIDRLQARGELLLAGFVAAWRHQNLITVGGQLKRRVGIDLQHLQDRLIDDQGQAVAVFDQHFLHRYLLCLAVTQSVYRRVTRGNQLSRGHQRHPLFSGASAPAITSNRSGGTTNSNERPLSQSTSTWCQRPCG